jgi:hypothetical protein
MIPAWWRRRLRNGTESAELSLPRDQLCHELRNALAGIQYERKQIAKSLITIQTHMARIEAALR